ncbi:hypothetical protein QFC22_005850 [Naganishia vaughanmartiniae]|uniref:Uncharacterized protein n=1 Tax=Naganishia vaughanmartiniae TaxID=1424756 RepID=A0ACC2WS67_9TREE|nr:hypothetical protein QFC22_005850 [Naganishia vaughanmartiniae]
MESAINSLVESFTITGSETTTSSLADVVTATTTEWLSGTLTASSVFPSATVDIGGGVGAGTGVAISEGNPVVNFLLGIMIVLGASVMNAFGLNLTKLDHMRAQALPKHSRPADWQRPLWLLGMLAYISRTPAHDSGFSASNSASQIFGSTLSLKYLRADWVAPLGSTSLVFNFLFAKLLVGVEVTRSDIRGTSLIVLGVLCILVFSSINHGLDGVITVERLSQMWSRGNWLAWFFFITFATLFVYETTHLLALLLKSRESLSPGPTALADDSLPSGGGRRKAPPAYALNPVYKALRGLLGAVKVLRGKALVRLERVLERTDDARVRFMAGIGWAVVGGSLAGGCLVFTKAVLLSLKKTEPDPAGGHTVSASNPSTSMRLNPIMHQQGHTTARPPLTTTASGSNTRARSNSRLSPRQTGGDSTMLADSSVEQVVWEVGSVSDDESDAGGEKSVGTRGVGGVAEDGYGERGGLLFDREEEAEEGAVPRAVVDPAGGIEGYRPVDLPSPSGSRRRRSGEEEEDPFGDFEDAKR